MAERTRHGWFCEKCRQFHDTEVETYHEPVGGVSDTATSCAPDRPATDRIVADSAVPVAPGTAG